MTPAIAAEAGEAVGRKPGSGAWLRAEGVATLLLLLPALAAFAALFCYPMLLTVVTSLRPEGSEAGWTLANYAAFLRDPAGQRTMLLTLGLALAASAASVLLSVPLALVLREKPAGHRAFRLVILVPLVVPGLIAALGLLLFWGPRGWFNLAATRWIPGLSAPLGVNYTIHGLVLFYVWLYFPYTAVTTLAALESLDRSIEEAGEVVGATRWQVLRYIVLPLVRPGIQAGSVLTFMAAFGAFSVPLIVGGDHRTLAVEIYKQIVVPIPARWSAASATAVVMGAMQVAALAAYLRLARRAGAER